MVDDSNAVRQEASHVTVHVKSDREPQIFRGDGTDRYSVQDWIDLTKAYLRKQKCPVREQAEEIMGRLVGKARDMGGSACVVIKHSLWDRTSDGLDGLAFGQMPEGPRPLVGRPITGPHACRVCAAASSQRGPTLSLGPLSSICSVKSLKLAICL